MKEFPYNLHILQGDTVMQYQLALSVPEDQNNTLVSSPDKAAQYLEFAKSLGWDVGTYKELVHG